MAGTAFGAVMLLLTAISLTLLVHGHDAANCPNNCNGTAVPVAKGECELTIRTTNETKYPASCVWTISPTQTMQILTLVVDNDMMLHVKDTLALTQKGQNVSHPDLAELSGRRGVGFTNATDLKTDAVTVTLTLTEEAKGLQRIFGLKYAGSEFTLPLEEHESYHIPIPGKRQSLDKQNPVIPQVKITLTAKGSTLNKTQVIEVEEITGTPDYQFDGSVTPNEFDVMGKDPKTPIVLSLKNFDPASSGLAFTMDLVDSDCSHYVEDWKQKPELRILGSEKQSANCLFLLKSDGTPIRIDYSRLVNLLGPSDLITIHGNGTEYQSQILAVLTKQNMGQKNDTRNQIISSGRLRLSYSSHFVANKAEQVILSFSQSPNSVVKDIVNETVTLKADSRDPNPVILIQVPNHMKASLKVGKTDAPKSNISFFSSPDTTSSPFLTLVPGQRIPGLIVSPTNTLRVVFSGEGDVSGSAAGLLTADSTAIGDTDSITMRTSEATGNEGSSVVPAGTSAEWLIPRRSNTSGSISLVIHSLTLDKKDSCLSLTKWGKEEKELVKECWHSGLMSQANENILLPEIRLHPSYSYVLRYTRSKDSTTDIPVLLRASFSYSPINGCSFDRKLGTEDNLIISPESYPMDVPVVDPELYASRDPKDDCGWRVSASEKSLVHTVFHDLDLKGNQSLLLAPFNSTGIKYQNTTDLPDDMLSPDSLMMHLLTPLDVVSNVTSRTGRGFKLTVTDVPCGGTIDLKQQKFLTTPGFPSVTNASRCLWLVKSDKSLAVLNITKTVTSGKQTDGVLRIFDAGSTRDERHMVNVTNATIWTSVESVIVEYKLSQGAKSAPGLNLTFQSVDCPSLWNGTARTCGDNKRCILPDWNCNGINDCGDNYDEIHCNVTVPVPTPAPVPIVESGGVSGWVIVLLIIPMSIGVGVLMTLFGPLLLTRLRGARYSEFRNFATEDT